MARALLHQIGVWYGLTMQWGLRVTLAMALGTLAGCLYLGGINHAPQASITIESTSDRREKGGSVTLKAWVCDKCDLDEIKDGNDTDPLILEWRGQYKAPGGEFRCLTDRIGGDAPKNSSQACPILHSGDRISGLDLTLDKLPERGTYTVELRVADELGADVRKNLDFPVENSAPQGISLKVSAEKAYEMTDQVPDHNKNYPAHAHYLVRVDENAPGFLDLEEDLKCGNKATIQWTLSKLPTGAQLEYAEKKSCQGTEILDRYRFRLLVDTITAEATITIRADIDDGHGGKTSATRELNLAPNRPPCILETYPKLENQVIPVLYNEGKTFDIQVVDDDVEPDKGFHFTWLRGDGKTFLPIPAQNGSSFKVPDLFGLPGDEVLLRVVVQDSISPFPACSAGTLLCAAHKSLPAKCYQWVTWRVRFM